MATSWSLAMGPGPDGRWHYRRSLASRVIWLTTIAVGMSVALVAVGAYITARVQMQDTLDNALVYRAEKAADSDTLLQVGSQGIPSWALGAGDVRIAILDYNERTLRILDRGPTLELGRSELEVAQGKSDRSLRTIELGGERYRVVAVPTQQSGLALIIAQPLEDQDRTLRRLGWVTDRKSVV